MLQIVNHNGLVLLVIYYHSEVHLYELIVYKKAKHTSESAKNHSIGSDSKRKNSAQGRIWGGGQVAKWVAKFGNGTAVSVKAKSGSQNSSRFGNILASKYLLLSK